MEQNKIQRMLDKRDPANQGRIGNDTEQAEGVGMAGGLFDLLVEVGDVDNAMFDGNVGVSQVRVLMTG